MQNNESAETDIAKDILLHMYQQTYIFSFHMDEIIIMQHFFHLSIILHYLLIYKHIKCTIANIHMDSWKLIIELDCPKYT